MAKEFTWLPDTENEVSHEPNVKVTKFGDGYEQRVANSVNSDPQKWELTFTRGRAEILAIRSFLREMGARTSFVWTNPYGETGRYVCRSWGAKGVDSKTASVLQLNATFEEVFEY